MGEGAAAAHGVAHKSISGRGLVTTLTRPSMVVVLWLAVLFHALMTLWALPARANRFDFSIYYASGLALHKNLNPYAIDLSRVGGGLGLEIAPINHATDPPTFLLCFEPLTLLPLRTAYWTWTALNLLAFVAALFLLLGRTSGLDTRMAWALAALAFLYPPVGDHFFWGQNKILVLLMLVLMMRWMEGGHDAAAGLILALAGLWRGFPLLLMGYLLLRGRWRALGYTIVGLVAGGIATVALIGMSNSLSFFSAGMHEVTLNRFLVLPINIALPSFVSQMFWYAAAAAGISAGPRFEMLRRAVVIVAELVLLGFTVRATIPSASGEDRDWRVFSLWVVTSVMLSPTAWVHYLVLMLLPFARLASAANRGRAPESALWMAAASFVVIALSMNGQSMFSPHSTSPVFITILEGGFLSLLMVYISTYWFATDNREAASELADAGAGWDRPSAPTLTSHGG
jgi:Glycosyltransferase family 87